MRTIYLHFLVVGIFSFSPLIRAATLRVPKQFASIQQAIDRAGPGDSVLVSAGIYRERVTLKRGVALRSDGDDSAGRLGLARAEATVLEGGGGETPQAGVAMAEGAVLDGFTVRNVGRYNDAEWKRHHATQGKEQAYEHIGAPGVAGVSIQGVTCDVRNNIVCSNGYTGIAITGKPGTTCSPLVVNNVCYRNMGGGIGSMNGSTAIIRGNVCFENFYAGIGHEKASPLVEGNRCFHNIRAGIGVSEGASPTVRGNLCYENRRAGIGIRTGADTRPLIENNECRDNAMSGIGTDDHARPTLRGNRCFRNQMAGIGARNQAVPVIVGNECFENGDAGIGLMFGKGTLVVSNYCHHNKKSGIGLAGGANLSAELRNNRLIENALVAVGVNPGWVVTLDGNEMARTGGMPPMIMVFKGATATLTNNTIRGSGVAGVRVSGTVAVINNRFVGTALRKVGPPQFGVWALQGAQVELRGNEFDSWRHALFADGAKVVARDNAISNAFKAAFRVKNAVGQPDVGGNRIAGEKVQELLME